MGRDPNAADDHRATPRAAENASLAMVELLLHEAAHAPPARPLAAPHHDVARLPLPLPHPDSQTVVRTWLPIATAPAILPTNPAATMAQLPPLEPGVRNTTRDLAPSLQLPASHHTAPAPRECRTAQPRGAHKTPSATAHAQAASHTIDTRHLLRFSHD